MRIITTTIIILALAAIAAYALWPKQAVKEVITDFESCAKAGYVILESYPEQCKTPEGTTFIKTPVSTTKDSMADMITVSNVTEDQILSRGFVVKGEARGGWYFEASFPVTLLDANNKALVQTYATAQGEWMTESFVPFSSQPLIFTPTTATGTLILKNDNPSGLPELDKEIRIPVRFETKEKTIKVYYYNSKKDTDASGTILCSTKGLVAVNRTVPQTITPIQDAITELLRGEITASETKEGIISNFPLQGVRLTGASLTDGTLTLTFTDPERTTSGGACRINVLRAQIEATAKQFPEVKTVRIMPATLFQP